MDDAAAAKTAAADEATRIRQAQGDINAERARMNAEADVQAEALLADGRVRLATEIAELARYVQTRVFSEFGVRLQAEPVLVGLAL